MISIRRYICFIKILHINPKLFPYIFSCRIKYISLIFPTAVAKLSTSCSTLVSDMHLVFLAGLCHRLYLDHHIYVTCLHTVNMCDVQGTSHVNYEDCINYVNTKKNIQIFPYFTYLTQFHRICQFAVIFIFYTAHSYL